MKNSKLFPFERNKYYYGKLLSVNDFELEQKYMNDKRRIISRLMLGSGVAAGMYVLQVDDFTVSVERGIALDFSGREIVIDDPVIKKLSLIDGYNTYKEIQNNRGYLYLCIEYAEEDTEAVYNVAGSNTAVSGSDYNKIREGFRLFLTDREPENKQLSPTDLYTEKQVIYFGNGIRITQSVPRFAGSGGKVPVKIRVENMGQQQLFAFSYNLALRCMSWEGKSHLKVSFNEAFFERAGSYEMTYTLEAHEVEDAEAFAEIEEDSFRLSVDQRPLNVSVSGRQTTKISGRNVISQLLDSYYQENMENYLKNNFQQSIYLAKISLIQAGESYVIHKVENMPFHQYLYPNELLAAMAELMMTGSSLSAAGFGDEDGRDSARPGEGSDIRMSWGEVEIHLGGKNVRGKDSIREKSCTDSESDRQ